MKLNKEALTLAEVATAVKVTNVSVTVTYEGETVIAIRTCDGGFGRGRKKADK